MKGAHSPKQRLDLSDVSRSFPGVWALQHVSFNTFAGEIHGLVGENGAGKSTLMAVASGALEPDEGTVTIDGHRIPAGRPAEARERGLAIVHQHPQLMPDLTVAENLFMSVLPAYRPPLGQIEGWAASCLARWRPENDIAPGTRVTALAPDQRFVVEIAAAIAQQPIVLILDEPTEHLASDDAELLFSLVTELAAGGCAIVYISHRIPEVRRLADRVTVLRDGVVQGTHAAADLTEDQIVQLIVGRPIETAFPAKPSVSTPGALLSLEDFQGPGFSPTDVRVAPGEIVGLAGIDGNGQRELLRALAGLVPSSGRVALDGDPVAVRSPRDAAQAGLAYLPDDRHREGILPRAGVRENVVLRRLGSFARAGVMHSAQERDAAKDAVARFDIRTPTIETPVGTLSGGNQQKAMLAGVLAADVRVLLADEPTQGVDIGARLEIYRTLRRYADQGNAVIMAASDQVELAGLCDRVLVMSRGCVASELSGERVTEHDITQAIVTATTVRQRSRRTVSRLSEWLAGEWALPAIVLLAVLILGAYAASANPFFLTDRSVLGILALTATLAFVGMAQQLVMLTGGIDLSVGPLMGLLVVIASFFLVEDGSLGRSAAGWVLLVVAALIVGVVNWSLVDGAKLHPMIATIVTFMGLQGISLLLRPTPDGLISGDLSSMISTSWTFIPAAFLVVVAVAVGLQRMLIRSRWGLTLRGVGSDSEAARLIGVNPRFVRLGAYVGCSLLTCAAAVLLLAQVGSGDPTAGVNYTLPSVAAAVLAGASIFGGRGSFVGCLLGALLIQQVIAVTTFLQVDAAWQSYLMGGMILLAVAMHARTRQPSGPA